MDRFKDWLKQFWKWVVDLDRILRGETTRVGGLPLGGISIVLVALGMVYGLCMGTFALFNNGSILQMLASMVKVPALFLLTLAVTLPSLYVFNALVGSRLTIVSLVRLFVAAFGVNLAVLASLGPIVAFFSVNTTTYSFIVLLNVLVFAVAGFLGLGFLLQTLHRISIASNGSSPAEKPLEPLPAEASIADAGVSPIPNAGEPLEGGAPLTEPVIVHPEGPLERVEGHVLGKHTKAVFRCWMVVFGLVGAQMGWVLRPYIGAPGEPFTLFRARQGNFFEAVWHAIVSLFG